MQNDATVLLLVSFTSRFCVIGMLGALFSMLQKSYSCKADGHGSAGRLCDRRKRDWLSLSKHPAEGQRCRRSEARASASVAGSSRTCVRPPSTIRRHHRWILFHFHRWGADCFYCRSKTVSETWPTCPARNAPRASTRPWEEHTDVGAVGIWHIQIISHRGIIHHRKLFNVENTAGPLPSRAPACTPVQNENYRIRFDVWLKGTSDNYFTFLQGSKSGKTVSHQRTKHFL